MTYTLIVEAREAGNPEESRVNNKIPAILYGSERKESVPVAVDNIAFEKLYNQAGESSLIDDRTRLYLRDLHDHILHVLANLDSYRDTAKGLIELSLSSMSHRTNEIMQVLTIIAAIFIPLTFIAGVYGMNFAIMPELQWRFGYPFALLLMVACAAGMLWYFKRKNWF